MTSIRTIQSNKNDARICIVENNNNFINILSGKIDHIFYAGEKGFKMSEKILVTGASSKIGKEFIKLIPSNIKVYKPSKKEWDFRT